METLATYLLLSPLCLVLFASIANLCSHFFINSGTGEMETEQQL